MKEYLIRYYSKTESAGIVKTDIINQDRMFDLVQKYHNQELDDDCKGFTVEEIGRCILDFS